jgi:hypothetical protein
LSTLQSLSPDSDEKQAFQWSPEAEAAYQLLKKALCTPSILGYAKPGERFIVDRQNIGIRGVLLQVQDNQEWITAY